MSYITENPWPLILLFAGIAIAASASGVAKGKSIALLSLILALGVYCVEQTLISPAEELEAEIGVMLDNFKAEDLNAITAQIGNGKDNLIATAKRGIDLVDLGETFAIKDVQVTMDSESNATAMVRANGPVLHKESSGRRHVASFWKTTWQRTDKGWKLSDAMMLDPVTGKEVDPFSMR